MMYIYGRMQYSQLLKKAIATAYAGACSHVFSEQHYSHHCAVVICGNSVISIAQNSHGIHAEIAALNRVDAKSCDLVVVRVLADGYFDLANSMPCVDCAGEIVRRGIRYIYYSDANGKIVRWRAEEFQSNYITLKNRIRNMYKVI